VLPTFPTGDTGVDVTTPSDRDGDGFPDDEDCAPDDPDRFPGAPEQCNGLDDDCDGALDPDADQDLDGDGASWCVDCEDNNAAYHPGAEDPLGDGVDQDCDGTDGIGLQLPPAAHRGFEPSGVYGFSLAAGDFDGSGCDDLAVGEPADPVLGDNELDRVSVYPGCGAKLPSVLSTDGGPGPMFGYSVAIGRDTTFVLQAYYRGDAGRILVYDAPFEPDAEPRLDIVGGYIISGLYGMAVLGDPPQWIQFAGIRSDTLQLRFNLVAVDRTGLVHLSYDVPDISIGTDAYGFVHGNFAADVGDRDGNGEVDLALPVSVVEDTVYFFDAVQPGHVADAPELWRGEPGTYTGTFMGGGGDLDGDGLDDALIGASLADGTSPAAGRVYLTPWLGPGDRSLADEAPARIDGERLYDWAGYATDVGDLDGDGQDDLVVGAPGTFAWSFHHGKAMVFLGPLAGVYDRYDADLLYVGEALGDHAGAAVALGDFDGSGRLDLAVGAPYANGDEVDAGAVYILHDPL
jgi:hypothetical protein